MALVLGGKFTPGTVAVDNGTETTRLGVVPPPTEQATAVIAPEDDVACKRWSFPDSFPSGTCWMMAF